MTRVFDAPRKLVFDAYTKPELLKRWLLGPPGWTMAVCEIDLRVGGAYRYVWRRDRRQRMGMGGVYREIVAARAHRLPPRSSTSPGTRARRSAHIVLVEQGGKTTLTQTVRYESREARDAVLKSPMEEGVAASFDRLAELVASVPAGEC